MPLCFLHPIYTRMIARHPYQRHKTAVRPRRKNKRAPTAVRKSKGREERQRRITNGSEQFGSRHRTIVFEILRPEGSLSSGAVGRAKTDDTSDRCGAP